MKNNFTRRGSTLERRELHTLVMTHQSRGGHRSTRFYDIDLLTRLFPRGECGISPQSVALLTLRDISLFIGRDSAEHAVKGVLYGPPTVLYIVARDSYPRASEDNRLTRWGTACE